MKKEIWKDIPNYKGLYKASNFGNIKACEKTVIRKKMGNFLKKEKVLSPKIDKDGYCLINLQKNRDVKMVRVHRVVAQLFIPNPKNKPHINHKNGIKSDNRIHNLEWVTPKENINHADDLGIMNRNSGSKNHAAKSVVMCNLQGKRIKTFQCIVDAIFFLKRGNTSSISAACRGKLKTAYGYKWKYKNKK